VSAAVEQATTALISRTRSQYAPGATPLATCDGSVVDRLKTVLAEARHRSCPPTPRRGSGDISAVRGISSVTGRHWQVGYAFRRRPANSNAGSFDTGLAYWTGMAMDTPKQPSEDSWIITVVASAGGINALTTILRALPRDLPAAVVVVQHRAPSAHPNNFKAILDRTAVLPVFMAEQDQLIQDGRVYVARSDRHLLVAPDRRFLYANGARIRYLLSSANPLFESAANAYKKHLVAVVLTGGGSDATDGVQSVKAHGGLVIAQDPSTAEHDSMPAAAVKSGAVDLVLPLEAIGPALDAIVRSRPIPKSPAARRAAG
jgi:two-component system chemotaxis response regulator CheB